MKGEGTPKIIGAGPKRVIFAFTNVNYEPVPVAARSKAYVCGHLPAEIVVSNPTG